MKLYLILAVVFSIGISSCKKEKQETNPITTPPSELTINSLPQMIATIDGKTLWITTQNEYITEQRNIWWDADSAKNRVFRLWGTSLMSMIHPNQSISIQRATITDTTEKTRVSEATFNSIFANNFYTLEDSLFSVTYWDENKKFWTTDKGVQTNSIEIVTSTPTQLGRKVLMKFDCVVYDTINGSTSKKISNASVVLEFRR